MKSVLGLVAVIAVLFAGQLVWAGVVLGAKWICPVCLEYQVGAIVVGVIAVAAGIGFLWLVIKIISMLLRTSASGRA